MTRASGNTVPILAKRLPPNNTGVILLDGVFQGTAVTMLPAMGVQIDEADERICTRR